jgi:allantoate deiminase
MKINGDRMLSDLNALRAITDTPGVGVTRFSYSQKDQEARAYITRVAESAGFAVRTDAVGNMFIRFVDAAKQIDEVTDAALEGADNEAKKIVVGSHIDTVRNGGWLDGVYGVVAGLEAMRILSEAGETELPLELVIFAEEEGSNFGSTMTGSKFITGIYNEEELDQLQGDQGISLRQMLERCGYPEYKKEEVVWNFEQVRAMLELHIEQGPVLERKGLSIGIVDVVYGMSVLEVTLQGVGNHAGATPMEDRRDALVAAAICIAEAERIAKEDSQGITVATVGKISVSPNCSNVIPERVVFTVEVRDKHENRIHRAMGEIRDAIVSVAKQRGVSCEMREIAYSSPIKMDKKVTERIESLASDEGLSYAIMSSGAVHDTCLIAAHAPAGMIFVPSKGGRSHVPFEDTDDEDLVRGAQLLLNTIVAL